MRYRSCFPKSSTKVRNEHNGDMEYKRGNKCSVLGTATQRAQQMRIYTPSLGKYNLETRPQKNSQFGVLEKKHNRAYLQPDLGLERLGGSTIHSHSRDLWMIYTCRCISSSVQLEYHGC